MHNKAIKIVTLCFTRYEYARAFYSGIMRSMFNKKGG